MMQEQLEKSLVEFTAGIVNESGNPNFRLVSQNEKKIIIGVAEQVAASLPSVRILDVGGGKGWGREIGSLANVDYKILDILPSLDDDRIIVGDICKKNDNLASDSFDFVFSKDTFEHLLEPWNAATEILRITKPGGVVAIACPFAWRYHPSPLDTYRFSHTGLRYLFERSSQFKTILAAYNHHKPLNGFWGNRKDHTFDGQPFQECWETILVGIKCECGPFQMEDLEGDFSKDHGGMDKSINQGQTNGKEAVDTRSLWKRMLRRLIP